MSEDRLTARKVAARALPKVEALLVGLEQDTKDLIYLFHHVDGKPLNQLPMNVWALSGVKAYLKHAIEDLKYV